MEVQVPAPQQAAVGTWSVCEARKSPVAKERRDVKDLGRKRFQPGDPVQKGSEI